MLAKPLYPPTIAQFGMLKHFNHDLPAGLAVALISIPLSLGIALASGAPLIAGLITGIIGGLVVAPFGASALGISGTAAGLAVIAHSDIQQLGFSGFLVAVVLAGIMQIALGMARLGVIAYYFPSSVVNGMLSGIGLIIMLKQIPHAVGYDRDYEGDIAFAQADHFSSFSELVNMLNYMTPGAVIIFSISLCILILWEQPFVRKVPGLSVFQGVLLAIVAGCVCNQLLRDHYPALVLQQEHLVNLPVFSSLTELNTHLIFPDFSILQHPMIYWTAFTLAIVASLETLLTVDAVDKLDPYKRFTPVNRELMAQGLGNVCCGLLGGLPLTQAIVRSSVNIRSGAKTKTAAVIHGLVFLLGVVLVPEWLNTIPLASLASVLMLAGFKLTRPSMVKGMLQAGVNNFVPFCATILGLLLTDMLTGIAFGFVVALIAILVSSYKNAFSFREAVLGQKTIIKLSEQVSFLNKANLLKVFKRIPKHAEVVIDASRARYIDYDVYEIIQNFKYEADLRQIKLTVENLRGYGELPPIESVRAHTIDTQQALKPAEVLKLLQEGNERFVNNLESNRNFLEQVNDTRQGQFPLAIILSCMDSRTSVELIFDQGLGDVFSTRVAGNIVNDDILGSMEYACKLAGSKLIVVLGHSHCGAIKGACEHVEMDHLTGLLAKIKPALAAIELEQGHVLNDQHFTFVQKVADRNVQLTVQEVRQRSQILAAQEAAGEIGIVGGMYDVETGKVNFFKEDMLSLVA